MRGRAENGRFLRTVRLAAVAGAEGLNSVGWPGTARETPTERHTKHATLSVWDAPDRLTYVVTNAGAAT